MLRRIPVFRQWPEAQLEEICAGAREIRAEAGKAVLRQGQVVDGLYVIVAGSLEVGTAQRDGRRYIRRYAEPGSAFGFMSLFDGQGSPYSYVAHDPAQLLFIEKSVLLAVLMRHPGLWLSVAEVLARFQRVALAVLEERIFESLRVRLARALVSLANAYGTREGEHAGIAIRITQDNLGSLLGVTRQSVSKELKGFEREGLIAIEYGRIVLADTAALEEMAREPTAAPALSF
jgi:CRP/FNR family cyclic AMP-dependent transcriptional regulator